MKRLILLGLACCLCTVLFAQTNNSELATSINDTGDAPDSSAILHVQAADKGLLIPRMNSTNRLAISSPANGLMVFDTTLNQLCYIDSATWVCVDYPGLLADSCITLDQAFDCGGPGAGGTINVDTFSVALMGTAKTTNTFEIFTITDLDGMYMLQGSATTGNGLTIEHFSPMNSGYGLQIMHPGSGNGANISLAPTATGTGLHVQHDGMTGSGIYVDQTLPANTRPAIYAQTMGTGDAIRGWSMDPTVGPVSAGVTGVGMADGTLAAALHAENGSIRVSSTSAPQRPAEVVGIAIPALGGLPPAWAPYTDAGGVLIGATSEPHFIPNVYAVPGQCVILLTVLDPTPPPRPYTISAEVAGVVAGGFMVKLNYIGDGGAVSGTLPPGGIQLQYLIINH